MTLVFNHPSVSTFVIERVGASETVNPGNVASIGVMNKDEVLGGVIYHDFTGEGGSIIMHMAGDDPHWITRGILWAAFDYPFNQLKVNRCLAFVPSNNMRALKIDQQLGFKAEAVIRGVYPDADCIILSMGREDCWALKRKPKLYVHDFASSSMH